MRKLIIISLISLAIAGCASLPNWMDRCVVFSYEAIYGAETNAVTKVEAVP